MLIDLPEFNAALLDALRTEPSIDHAALDRATAIASQDSTRVDQTLLRLGLIDEAILLPLICQILRIPFIASPNDVELHAAFARELGVPYLSSQVIVPICDPEGNALLLMADPMNAAQQTEVGFHLDQKLPTAGATTATIRALLATLELPADITERHLQAQTARDAETLRRVEADGPVIKFVHEKLSAAVIAGASDIHFESTETGLDLRFRINGMLVPQRVDPLLSPATIMARLKVMAGVNVAERRLPQDGRMEAMIAGRKIDFRFSSLPTQWGESIVCRVLDPKALRLGWDRLGFPAEIVGKVKTILGRPSGLFLVTGPTGSGKTTTLYTALAHLNSTGRKIITVEDPVEYNLPGVQQVQVHEEIGLTFPRVLRGILRHDPNAILIGEIRDEETAEIAVRAAQVGRLVLSTLHTNSAAGAVTRLVDLGVPEFLVRDVLRGVLAQELLVTPCPACGGASCATCGGTGVGERRLVAELWEG